MRKTQQFNWWKFCAIFFLFISIAEAVFICWAWNLGNQAILDEELCAYDVCDLDESSVYDAYAYNDYIKMCYCYKDGEIAKSKHLEEE